MQTKVCIDVCAVQSATNSNTFKVTLSKVAHCSAGPYEEDFKSEYKHECKVFHIKIAALLSFRRLWPWVAEQKMDLWDGFTGGAQVQRWFLSYPSTELCLFKLIFNYSIVITFLRTLRYKLFRTLTITHQSSGVSVNVGGQK